MTTERFEVQRTIAADPAAIFRVLCDPQGHVAIDSSGMLHGRRPATRRPRSATRFVVHMDREALNDFPMGQYDVTVTHHDVRARPRDRVDDPRPDPAADRPRLRLHARAGRRRHTLVTSYYDWSDIDPVWKEADIFPIISEGALRATLGILARTVQQGGSDTGA